MPVVGYGDRSNDGPQRGGPYEVPRHERHPYHPHRSGDYPERYETRVHENRHEQALSTLVDPHHQHPVGGRTEKRIAGVKRARGTPAEVPLPQMFERKCHAPHRSPTKSPVARTPWRPRSLGMANPVHPSSSKRPVNRPTLATKPNCSMDALTLVVRKPGRNSGEISESERSVAMTVSGVVRSATAYHRAPTRHLSNLDPSSRNAVHPPVRPVNRSPARLGPATVTRYTAGNSLVVSSAVPGIAPTPPMIRSMPPHEMANARAK